MGGARCPVRFLDNSVKFHRHPFLGAAKVRNNSKSVSSFLVFLLLRRSSVPLHRYLVGDSLMTTAVVVILDVVSDTPSQARNVILWVDVDVLGLDGTPEAFNPDVVLAASTPVHADLDAILLTGREPKLARVLAALVGVDNLWRTVTLNGHLQDLDTVLLVQRIMKAPGHDTAAVDIDDGCEIHEAV